VLLVLLGRIGFVVGLTAEAALLKGAGCRVGIGGGTPAGAADAADSLVDQGAEALVSFGLAGGLNPALAAGAVLVPSRVVEGAETYFCDPALVARLGGETCAVLLAGDAIAITAVEKASLFARHGADGVDLESGAVARVASARGVKFAVLRAVCDPAGRDLPPAALQALDGGGKIGLLRVIASVLRKPAQLPGLFKLARDARAARDALKSNLKSLN
jgi:adenosylhomocysteine nucleosidase